MSCPLNPLPGDFFYGDADIEVAGLEAIAGRMDALKAKGHCMHGGCCGNDGPEGGLICNESTGGCKSTWATTREWWDAHVEAREGGQS